ncbi:SEMA5 [Lepeophtheirus salmonis]|uniref:SEMA5 n=1 Tax=Lepeophtheirus salmonis TaxID=72036 RepID=A0A7R8D903_LEPSM|nr:SEMA5 [Lepeophtheirus salmonis]CAF3039329.1 SEMA5 [Lepeophtheirus salmonis]
MKKSEDSQCSYQLPEIEWKTLMTGLSNSTLLQVKSSLQKELWRYLDPDGNYLGMETDWKAFTGLSSENEQISFGEILYLDDIGQYSDEELFLRCMEIIIQTLMAIIQFTDGPEKRPCGLWGSWESWSPCNESIKIRKRVCNKPSPTAEDCIGRAFSSSECTIGKINSTLMPTTSSSGDPISTPTPTERACTQYEPWSGCSVSCGIGGIKRRIIQCGSDLKIEPEACSAEVCTEGKLGRKRKTTSIISTLMSTTSSSGDPISSTTPTERTCTQYEPWSGCSVSCGIGGIKRRILQYGSDLKIESEECSSEVCTEVSSACGLRMHMALLKLIDIYVQVKFDQPQHGLLVNFMVFDHLTRAAVEVSPDLLPVSLAEPSGPGSPWSFTL